MYSCKRCGYFTGIRGNLRNHFNRKIICKPILFAYSIEVLKAGLTPTDPGLTPIDSGLTPTDPGLTPIDSGLTPIDSGLTPIDSGDKITKYQCDYCNKFLSKSSNLHRHYARCKEISKLNDTNILKDKLLDPYLIIQQLMKEKEEMRRQHSKEVEGLIEKVGTVNNIGTQINIKIYGNENLDYLTPEYFQNLLKGPYGAIQKLIKDVHFNPNHPENHNIKITNRKFPHVSVYEGGDTGWKLKDKKEMITDIVDKSYNKLDEHYEEYGIIDNVKETKYTDFQEKYDSGNKKVKKDLNKDTELIILNGSKDLQ